jgi:hypothetical protein
MGFLRAPFSMTSKAEGRAGRSSEAHVSLKKAKPD